VYLVLSPLTQAQGGALEGVRGLLQPQLLYSDRFPRCWDNCLWGWLQ